MKIEDLKPEHAGKLARFTNTLFDNVEEDVYGVITSDLARFEEYDTGDYLRIGYYDEITILEPVE